MAVVSTAQRTAELAILLIHEGSHNVLFFAVVDAKHFHGVHQRLDGCEDVLKHQAGEASPVGLAVSSPVDDPHLFDERALPAFTSACREIRSQGG